VQFHFLAGRNRLGGKQIEMRTDAPLSSRSPREALNALLWLPASANNGTNILIICTPTGHRPRTI
jgi:hypothetical protein